MPEEFYVVVIVALLPLTALMLVSQVNPYHALVIRGILGAVAALVYALFGAADVALTEALVGTMLSITLYAVAVRSSLSMRVGILEEESSFIEENSERPHLSYPLRSALRKMLSQHHMRLELVPYPSWQVLHTALMAKDIHAVCTLSETRMSKEFPESLGGEPSYQLQTRIRRLYDLMQAEISPALAEVTYVESVQGLQPDANRLVARTPNSVEAQS